MSTLPKIAFQGEPGAKLEEEVPNLREQRALEIAFAQILVHSQKVEVVRILEQLAGEVGLRSGKRPYEVRDCLPLAVV